jgi:hypothetical protein
MTNDDLNYNIVMYIMNWSVSMVLLSGKWTISKSDFPNSETWNPAENIIITWEEANGT